MEKANQLNQCIAEHAPAAFRMLSDLGARAAFPDGVPAQAAEAAGCTFNGSIGQVTDGYGNALPLATIQKLFSEFPLNDTLLYPPQLGLPALRQAWAKRTADRTDRAPLPPPMVTIALTHAISLCADLFSDADTTVLTPTPFWGNYSAVFGLRRGANMKAWPIYNEAGGLNVDAFSAELGKITGKGIVVLNFPGNPTGYSPTIAEADALVEAIAAHPNELVVLVDDAYQGLVYEENALQKSIFYRLQNRLSVERHLLVKVDGATKEFSFFGGRVGFLTFNVPNPAADALYDKAAAIARATVSAAPAPSQVAVLACLQAEDLASQIATVRNTLAERYHQVRAALPLLEAANVQVHPFNSGCFALLKLPAHLDAHSVRRRLIQEQSVGLVALPKHQALRLAYCSMHTEQIQPALERLSSSLLS